MNILFSDRCYWNYKFEKYSFERSESEKSNFIISNFEEKFRIWGSLAGQALGKPMEAVSTALPLIFGKGPLKLRLARDKYIYRQRKTYTFICMNIHVYTYNKYINTLLFRIDVTTRQLEVIKKRHSRTISSKRDRNPKN